jgi:Nitrate reductase gamma subunit
LTEAGLAYAHAVAAVCETRRAATDQQVARAQRLAQAGPPREAVGLQPFTLTVPLVAPKEAGDMQGEIFWDVAPYVTLAIVVVGAWWRYRDDEFGWTTRSSQLYESRLLPIASPMFHFGILVVVFAHVIGLLIPES